jgi:hypothetical protein
MRRHTLVQNKSYLTGPTNMELSLLKDSELSVPRDVQSPAPGRRIRKGISPSNRAG